jgi:predicted nucleotide-binding protein
VFISSSIEGLHIAREIAHQLEAIADVNIWSAAFRPGLTAAESLTEVADRSDFAIFVMAGGDHWPRGQSEWSPRPNVIFEMGFLAGRLGLDRIFIVVTEHDKTAW